MLAENSTSEEPSYTDLLSRLLDVTEEQMIAFRKKVIPGAQQIFDLLPENQRMIVTAIDSFTEKELLVLKQNATPNGRSVGFHEIEDQLFILTMLTGDPRFAYRETRT